MTHLIVINLLFSVIIVFFQRRDPSSVWTWLLALNFIPVFGIVFYLLFGQDLKKSRMFKVKEISDRLNMPVRNQEKLLLSNDMPEEMMDPMSRDFSSLILYNLNEGEAVLTDNNDIRVYTDGREKFDALLSEMDHARNYIHLQYYIIRNDELWQEIEEVLLRKARQGTYSKSERRRGSSCPF